MVAVKKPAAKVKKAAAKKPATKKQTVKKSAVKVAKKTPAKNATTRVATKLAKGAKSATRSSPKSAPKKIAKPRAPRLSQVANTALDAVAEAAPADTSEEERGVGIATTPEWYIVQIIVSNMTVFGLANDQRVYRWNPRNAIWHLHKEGV